MISSLRRFYRRWVRPSKKYRWRVTVYYYFAGPLNIWSCKTYRNLHLAHRAARKSAARADIFVHELHRIDWAIRKELKGTKGCTKNKNCRDCKIKLKEK